MSKPTEGPWFFDERTLTVFGAIDVDRNDQPTVRPVCELFDSDERDANAALIASSPELLHMLREAVEMIGDMQKFWYAGTPIYPGSDLAHATGSIAKAARLVIKKAEGK